MIVPFGYRTKAASLKGSWHTGHTLEEEVEEEEVEEEEEEVKELNRECVVPHLLSLITTGPPWSSISLCRV